MLSLTGEETRRATETTEKVKDDEEEDEEEEEEDTDDGQTARSKKTRESCFRTKDCSLSSV